MEIQQKEMESLAAYIHHFERESKRCNFTNSTAAIRILVMGLRNAQMLATGVYEKGLQTLADAINEVKKLPSHVTINSNSNTILNSKCYVP